MTRQIRIIYWAFGDNVASMTVNFRGTTSKGTVSDSRIFTKSQAAEHYDDDSEYFTGGETLIVNMKPAVSTSGEVTGIDVGLNIIFEDHTDEVEIPVNWDKPITISEPNGTNYLANGNEWNRAFRCGPFDEGSFRYSESVFADCV